MMIHRPLRFAAASVLSLTLLAGGCQNSRNEKTASGNAASKAETRNMLGAKTAIAHMLPSKAATTQPANNNVTGTVTFIDLGQNRVKVIADLTGLKRNSSHGFHIHEKGDLASPDLMSTGGHYNPEHHPHGAPGTQPVHAGDLGNITADASGNAHMEITVDDLSIGGPGNDILGKAVILHAKADDLSSQPAGNAGARIAGGVIELQK